MSLLVPPRLNAPELLDEHDAPRADMERSLRDLRRINKYLGGIATYKRMVRRITSGVPASIVDVGAGSSDALESLGPGGLRIALDFKIDHLLYLRAGSPVLRVVGDAQQLPFRDRSVDVVTSAHFFHHFTADENVQILRESLRICMRGVAVNDTQRHYAPLLFVRAIIVLGLVGRITRYDAPASVRRGYTAAEAAEVASRVGASRAEVVRFFPFRFAILLRK